MLIEVYIKITIFFLFNIINSFNFFSMFFLLFFLFDNDIISFKICKLLKHKYEDKHNNYLYFIYLVRLFLNQDKIFFFQKYFTYDYDFW